MTSSSSSVLVLALLANLALGATACSGFGAEADAPAGDAPVPSRTEGAAADGADAAAGPVKAPPVGGPAADTELTDQLGIFVATTGQSDAAGTRAQPLVGVQAGIDLAKRVGKRVYVCAGTYSEALTIADSISVIGGLDCTGGKWRTNSGAGRSRIESPTSPALRAQDIVTNTRIDGLEIIAPDATAPGGSSIGLIASNAGALVIARSKVVAGNAAAGADGVEGIQLVNSATVNGGAVGLAADCVNGNCDMIVLGIWASPARGARGVNACEGAPGHDTQVGGYGGSGGLWTASCTGNPRTCRFVPYRNASYAAELGVSNRTSANGTDAANGTNALFGVLSADGYTPASGATGMDGTPGLGGAGGNGASPERTVNAGSTVVGSTWRGDTGGGGGAGGCPGLAGTAGTGGGASIAVLLTNSATTFEATELVSANGGRAGSGTFGSAPTAGGAAAFLDPALQGFFGTDSKLGGRGGAAGISGNGSNGPSLGIAHSGPAPKVDAATKITLGAGGAAIDARSRTDAFGSTKTVPATPAGASTNILAF